MNVPNQLQEVQQVAPEEHWSRFVSRLLWTASIGLLVVAALNFLVNPDGIYPIHLLPQLTWGSRPEKTEMLKKLTPAPRALILGSSRVMPLLPADVERLTGLPTFNAGVDSAKAEDFYIILRYAVEVAHVHPQLLILGCDVEAFHNQEPVHYYLQLPTLLSTFLKRGTAPYWRWQQFTKLFSYQQAELSAIALFKSLRPDSHPLSRTEPDGHIYFDEWERQRTTGEFDLQREIKSTEDRFTPRYDEYTGLSQERLDYFNDTLHYAHDHDIKVLVFVPPIHPELERRLEAHGYGDRKREALAALQRVCDAWGVPFKDFSSAQLFGGDDRDFYDGVHYDGRLASLLIAHLIQANTHAVQ